MGPWLIAAGRYVLSRRSVRAFIRRRAAVLLRVLSTRAVSLYARAARIAMALHILLSKQFPRTRPRSRLRAHACSGHSPRKAQELDPSSPELMHCALAKFGEDPLTHCVSLRFVADQLLEQVGDEYRHVEPVVGHHLPRPYVKQGHCTKKRQERGHVSGG